MNTTQKNILAEAAFLEQMINEGKWSFVRSTLDDLAALADELKPNHKVWLENMISQFERLRGLRAVNHMYEPAFNDKLVNQIAMQLADKLKDFATYCFTKD